MTEDERSEKWDQLLELIENFLTRYGQEYRPGEDGDYLVVGDDYGRPEHMVSFLRLRMLTPEVVLGLQELLVNFPDWSIYVGIAVHGKEYLWPEMGLIIRKHEIVDGLQREYFPPEYRGIHYPGSRVGTVDD